MSEVTVTVRDNGELIFLDTPEAQCFKALGSVTTRRASHVEPDSWLLRLAFHALRHFYGDKGRMSDFTRNWPCLWRVNTRPTGGPILPGRWRNRQEAIDAEVSWLGNHLE
jgi:hypothetical protein